MHRLFLWTLVRLGLRWQIDAGAAKFAVPFAMPPDHSAHGDGQTDRR
jgi:hypothetical protein